MLPFWSNKDEYITSPDLMLLVPPIRFFSYISYRPAPVLQTAYVETAIQETFRRGKQCVIAESYARTFHDIETFRNLKVQ